MRDALKNSAPGKYTVVESFKQNGHDLWMLAQLEPQLRSLIGWRRRDLRDATKLLASAKECAERLGLETVRAMIERAIRKPGDRWHYRKLAVAIRLAVEAEIEFPVIYRVPSQQAHFMLDLPPFGNTIDRAFPEASPYFQDAAFAAAHGRNAMAATNLITGVEAAIKSIAPMVGIEPESRDLLAQLACQNVIAKSLRKAVGCAQTLRDEIRNPHLHGQYRKITDSEMWSIWGATGALLRSLLAVRSECESTLATARVMSRQDREADQ